MLPRAEAPAQSVVGRGRASDAEAIRDLDLPHSALWIDRPYATGVNTFDFDQARFADPAAMIDTLHDLGLRVALWHSP